MSEDAGRAANKTTLAAAVNEARVLADERMRALSSAVPLFPSHVQPAVVRLVDTRVSELIHQRSMRSLKALLSIDGRAPFDGAAFRQHREQVLALQALLRETGGGPFGERLVATLDGELLRRLAGLHAQWQQQPLQEARSADFGWWQGEPLPLAQALGATEPAASAPSLARTAAQLDLLVRQARTVLALGSPGLASDPAALRWLQLQAEVDRYQARAGDSSLLRLEHYLGAMGADLRRENCTERLAGNLPLPVHDDAVAQRHAQLHRALAQRCGELRVQAAAPAASLAQ